MRSGSVLKQYIDGFDFSIVWFLTPQEILNQHRETRYWYHRFKIDPPTRPDNPPTPDDLQGNELVYVTRLYEAYSERLNRIVKEMNDLVPAPEMHKHFKRSRGHFFSAEALSRFSRDQFTQGAFDKVKGHVHTGVEDVLLEEHADGIARLLEVTKTATMLALPQSDITPYVAPADLIEICHHLANDGKLCWVKQ
jgi:hypothetical protein